MISLSNYVSTMQLCFNYVSTMFQLCNYVPTMSQLCFNYVSTMFQLCFNYVSTMFQLQFYDAPRNTPQPMSLLMFLSGWHAILIRSQDRCRAVRHACNAARTPGGGRRGPVGWEGSRNVIKQSPAELPAELPAEPNRAQGSLL